MGYIVNRYNGTVLTVVEDGTINLTTEIKFVGKNFAGYGETQNENFLHLLENFSNPTPPGKPLSGMIWYDSTAGKIKFYDGTRWRSAGSAEVSATQPVGLVEGDIWWNSTTSQLFARSAAGEWVLVGPQTTALGTTQFVSRTIQGFNDLGVPTEYSIIEAVLSDGVSENTTLVVSDASFTINDTIVGNAINNFTNTIRRGITMSDTNSVGISTDAILWGTASNALLLGGLPASSYVNQSDLSFSDPVVINNVLSLSGNGVDTGVIENVVDQTLIFIVRDNDEDLSQTVLTVNLTGLIPGIDNTYDIGTSALRWKDVHAVSFRGTADRANELRVGSTYRTASDAQSEGTVVARTNSPITVSGQTIPAGAVRANFFVGTAIQAQYADLAEKYTTGQEWPVGTAMAICAHEEHEADAAGASSIAIGVISENPAYLMNAEIEGQAIALKGRVPVRVVGPVQKGQAIYAWANGVCSTVATTAFIGVALESSSIDAEKLVECVLKV